MLALHPDIPSGVLGKVRLAAHYEVIIWIPNNAGRYVGAALMSQR
jgi:hypothetical protein